MYSSTMPRPALPFKFGKKITTLEEGDEPVKLESNIDQQLIALLLAKGVSFNQISELVGADAKDALDKARNNRELSKWTNAYSVRLNESVEQRIKRASNQALDKLLDILNNPRSAPKEILSAAKDILDRELGKAKQQVEFTGITDSSEDLKSIVASTKAVEERLALMDQKRKQIEASFVKTEIIDIQ